MVAPAAGRVLPAPRQPGAAGGGVAAPAAVSGGPLPPVRRPQPVVHLRPTVP